MLLENLSIAEPLQYQQHAYATTADEKGDRK